jgi:hypothetical protein
MRDHEPLVLEEFNGWWSRGDLDSCPPDHFTESNNIRYFQGGFDTRGGAAQYLAEDGIVKMYAYNTADDGFLILKEDSKIYDIKITGGSAPSFTYVKTMVLSVPTMNNFKYLNINGRAYITPMKDLGQIMNEFIYVYERGVGTHKVGGVGATTGTITAANGAAGKVDAGYHVFGVVYLSNSGFFTKIGPTTKTALNATGAKKVDLSTIPVPSDTTLFPTKYIVATKAINPSDWTGNLDEGQFFFVPGGDMVSSATTKTVDFFDTELLDDASYLFDIRTELPSATDLSMYHGRMVALYKSGTATYAYVSAIDEPEVVDTVSGIIDFPENGLGNTAAHVYRDVLYVCKINSTIAVNDNNDEPSSWPKTVIDEGIGSGLFGMCLVGIYKGGVNIEFLINFDYNGIWVFDGVFRRPEVSWKIDSYWKGLSAYNIANLYEIYNDPLKQRLYILLQEFKMIIVGDYENGLDFKSIKWSKWVFDENIRTMCLFDKNNKLIVGSPFMIYHITEDQTFDNWTSGAVKIPDPTIITALLGD